MRRNACFVCAVALTAAVTSCGGGNEGAGAGSPVAPEPAPGPPLPRPPTGAPHAYFEALRGRTDVIADYSLRDQSMLNMYGHGPGSEPPYITYDYDNDPYPNKQDAAKVTIPADQVSLERTVRLPIPQRAGENLLVTWDAWWGREFDTSHSALANYKNFQFASPEVRIWTEIKTDFNSPLRPAGSLAMVLVRAYGSLGESLGPNVTNENPLSPQRAQFALAADTWTRYWALFRPVGEWYEFSLWVADETRNAVLLLDRLQIKPNYGRGAETWESFWLEYNTSGTRLPPGRGPLVGYVRNVLMMRYESDVSQLLQRPGR